MNARGKRQVPQLLQVRVDRLGLAIVAKEAEQCDDVTRDVMEGRLGGRAALHEGRKEICLENKLNEGVAVEDVRARREDNQQGDREGLELA